MTPDPENAPAGVQPANAPSPDAQVPRVTESPWVAFVVGKKRSADRFLSNMVKDRIPVPDAATVLRFAEAASAKPNRLVRVLDLLQAASNVTPTLQGIVAELAQATAGKLGVKLPADGSDATMFTSALQNWLGKIEKRPLKKHELEVLVLLLRIAAYRQVLNPEMAFASIEDAVYKRRKGDRTPSNGSIHLDPVAVLLSNPPTQPVLTGLLKYHRAHTRIVGELGEQVESVKARASALDAQLDDLRGAEARLTAEIAQLRAELSSQSQRNQQLEGEMVAVVDGYKHKLSELRGRIRGIMDGPLLRHLETALEASRGDSPWIEAIQEKLEDALALMEKERKWLQPSV